MHRSENLKKNLLDNTVFSDFFQPMLNAFDKVRFSEKRFGALPMTLFTAISCLRQIHGVIGLREQIQQLFHLTEDEAVPVARSTYSDAMNSSHRLSILSQAFPRLIEHAKTALPDRLKAIEELGQRPVYAADGSYFKESAHYKKKTPKQDGNDNPKGHMMLTCMDLRLGQTIRAHIERSSTHEIEVLKREMNAPDSLFKRKHALWVVDRAFIHCAFWDTQKQRYKQTMITRMKENLVITERVEQTLKPSTINEGVISDERITLKASEHPWRLIHFRTRKDETLEFVTNELDLEPGIVAFMYLRRWDQEKCYDTWKNDYACAKAWSKSQCGLEIQVLIAMITSVLLALFCQTHQQSLEVDDEKSFNKQEARVDREVIDRGASVPWHRFYYRATSKISRQIIRFVKNCCFKLSSPQLYEKQLKPLFLRYL